METGRLNRLKIVREVEHGLYLEDEDGNDVLLPARYVTDDMEVDGSIEVFVYLDTDDLPVATTETPLAMVGDFALLEVVAKENIGAFLNWGLAKDLFVPRQEQKDEMFKGESYLVRVYVDNSGRIAASTKLDKFMSRWPAEYKDGQEVDFVVCEKTELGVKAIVEGKHWGLIYNNEIFQELVPGQKIRGWIKKMRDDEKIDLALRKPSFDRNQSLQDRIVDFLKEQGGHSDLNDKSTPELIYKTFSVSKSQYKNALGMLYKQRRVKIDKSGVTLLEKKAD